MPGTKLQSTVCKDVARMCCLKLPSAAAVWRRYHQICQICKACTEERLNISSSGHNGENHSCNQQSILAIPSLPPGLSTPLLTGTTPLAVQGRGQLNNVLKWRLDMRFPVKPFRRLSIKIASICGFPCVAPSEMQLLSPSLHSALPRFITAKKSLCILLTSLASLLQWPKQDQAWRHCHELLWKAKRSGQSAGTAPCFTHNESRTHAPPALCGASCV